MDLTVRRASDSEIAAYPYLAGDFRVARCTCGSWEAPGAAADLERRGRQHARDVHFTFRFASAAEIRQFPYLVSTVVGSCDCGAWCYGEAREDIVLWADDHISKTHLQIEPVPERELREDPNQVWESVRAYVVVCDCGEWAYDRQREVVEQWGDEHLVDDHITIRRATREEVEAFPQLAKGQLGAWVAECDCDEWIYGDTKADVVHWSTEHVASAHAGQHRSATKAVRREQEQPRKEERTFVQSSRRTSTGRGGPRISQSSDGRLGGLRSMANGSVELPQVHLSARVPWHDTDWTGRVCAAPGANHSCTVLKNVAEKKDADAEEENAGAAWDGLDHDRLPPCVQERAGFMRPAPFTITRNHVYSGGWTPSHAHFAPTAHRLPAYSVEAVPFRWIMRDYAPDIAASWGIDYDPAIEEAADAIIAMKGGTNWVQDHRNQLALLDSFFSAVVPQKSLVFLYAKDLPLVEDRPPGARMLVGVGRVTDVGKVLEWEYSQPGPLRSILWERAILHSIRADGSDGFLLPYQQLFNDLRLQGEDLSSYVAFAPPDHFDEFSYVTEHVGHDGAIAALLELARVVELLPGVADGPWDRVGSWLSDRVADVWRLRGPYPGLGSALTAAGVERGALLAHRVVSSLPPGDDDPWPAVTAALADTSTGPAAGLVGRTSKKAWERVRANEEQFALLRLVARFPLTVAQARRFFDEHERAECGIDLSADDLLHNPYLLYEEGRIDLDPIGLATIDRGLFSRDSAAIAVLRTDPLPDPVEEASDDRRVRAGCVEVLERARGEGHTLLDEGHLRVRLRALELDPPCDPPSAAWDVATDEFARELSPVDLAAGAGVGWQLNLLAVAAEEIGNEVAARLAAGPLEVDWDWRACINAAITADPGADLGVDEAEEAARTEKADALRILARSRISVLVGPAGTGKTTMLRALCTHPDVAGSGVLLLAPTGKARVQLSDKVGHKAQTLAQFLRRSGRWDRDSGQYLIRRDQPPESGRATVVVDEASMLTEEMVAALINGLSGVRRLIFCGDHRQLPPIGAGRPFADLVRHLRETTGVDGAGEKAGGGLAELTVLRRQRSRAPGRGSRRAGTGTAATGRDDLAVASWFSVSGAVPAADEAFSRVLTGRGDGTIEIRSWDDEPDLHRQMVEVLGGLGVVEADADSLRVSLGATGTYNGRPSFEFGRAGAGAENWQILSPVRARPGGVHALNRLVRRTWRAGDAHSATKSWKLPPPMGPDEILFYDKVMCIENHGRKSYNPLSKASGRGEVANGEIGMVVHWPSYGNKKPAGLKVEFSSQPGLQFTFWSGDLDATGERSRSLLELAYAVTVHKSQGSQFGVTLVVVPNPCPLLSPELLYTALTRQRERTVLFVQGDPTDLRSLTGPARSETARRLTCLFSPPDPFEASDGTLLDAAHCHRTANGEMVCSKSEVIVANTLRHLGVRYLYEEPLTMPDKSWRLPDFTIDLPGGRRVYWEHLGLLDDAHYRAGWDAKRTWYADHGILPWQDGGGPGGALVWSTENRTTRGIDAVEIEELARKALGLG